MNFESVNLAKEELSDFNDEYQSYLKEEKRLFKRNKEFTNHFNISFIENQMEKEDYCIGRSSNTENFCYIIERELRALGSILGASSSKFGLYWSKHKNKYIHSKKFGKSEIDAFEKIRQELVYLINAAKSNRLIDASKSNFCYMLRHKIYYLYNPEDDLPIFSEDHLNKVLSYFEIEYERNGDIESNKRRALYNFKKNDPDFSKMTNRQFMAFLYDDRSGLDLKQKKIIEKNKKDETIDFQEIAEISNLSSSKIERKKGKTNYDDVAARKSYIGEAGEELVLRYEREKHPDYKRKIIRVSLEDDSFGYDILSFDNEGNEVHIEVKTKKTGSADNIDFYITENELNALANENHVIYYVCGIKTKCKKIYAIRRDVITDELLKPVLYRVKAKRIQ